MKHYDAKRLSARERYGSKWDRISQDYRRRVPNCEVCWHENRRLTPAVDVDHKDGNTRNHAESNLQAICRKHHNQKTARGRGKK